MRLLQLKRDSKQADDGFWALQSFSSGQTPFYGILSHTWGLDSAEVTFEDLKASPPYSTESRHGYEKLRFCHQQVEKDGLTYFWIDTCCIDKTNAVELDQSLNSMFYWYQKSVRCYVLLADVSIDDSIDGDWENAFARSRWFKRGWTLQELVAPSSTVFYSKEGERIGDKHTLLSTVSKITGIPEAALKGAPLSRFSKGERLSWAKGRETKVAEDAAYCLVGIFDVDFHMTYVDDDYSKRKRKALEKLGEEIDKSLGGAPEPDDLIQIGAASYRDLSNLSEDQLQQLDTELEKYKEWFLWYGPRQGDHLARLSSQADSKMRELLGNFGIFYDDFSGPDVNSESWKKYWGIFKATDKLESARVQAFLENRLYWAESNERNFSCIRTMRTLIGLMVWRGKWTMNSH